MAAAHSLSLTRAQVKALDQRASQHYGIPTLTLMENAGGGAAAMLVSLGIRGPVAIGCGKGNNGGDGLVMARWLALGGCQVWTCLFAAPEELSPEAAANWRAVENLQLPRWVQPTLAEWSAMLRRADWTVDAFFGTGLQGPVRPPFDHLIPAANASRSGILAVDLPSGLDADTGEPMGATIRARHTVTFVAPKKGFNNPAARSWTGKVHVVDIGVPLSLIGEGGGQP